MTYDPSPPSSVDPLDLSRYTYDELQRIRDAINDLQQQIDMGGDFFLNVAAGRVPGHSSVNVDGYNPDIDSGSPEDVWDGGGDYVYSTTNDITHIVSDNAADTFEVKIQGLDVNWNFVTQLKTLTGITSVALDTPLLRAEDMDNVSSTPQVGIIQCGVGSTTSSFATANLRAQMNVGINKCQMSMRTIPAGKVGFATNIRGSVAKSGGSGVAVNVQAFVRSEGGVFRAITPTEISSLGSSHFQELFMPYAPLLEKTDIKIRADVSGNNIGVQGGYDLILVDKGLVPIAP